MTKDDIKIRARFKEASKKMTGVSTFLAYAEAVRGTGVNRGAVYKGLKALVAKGDYAEAEEDALYEWLVKSASLDNKASTLF